MPFAERASQLLSRLRPSSTTILLSLVAAFIRDAILYLTSSKNLYTFLQELLQDPVPTGLTFSVALVGLSALRFTAWHFWLGLKANRAGLESVLFGHPYAGEDIRSEDEQERDYSVIKRELSEAIRAGGGAELILVSGYKAIGTRANPGFLYSSLQRARHVEILVLDPESSEAVKREDQLKRREVIHGATQYRDGIREVIANLEELARYGVSVEIKTYHQRPIWRMLIVDDLLFLAGAATDIPSERATVFVLRRAQHSLFHPLSKVFEKKWYGGDTESKRVL